MTPTLAELGEAELLKRLARFAPPEQFDDDTACLGSDPRPLLVNTDVLVDGIHFSDATTDAHDVGWRAVAANLSDLAASGAVSIDGITVALVAPGTTPWSWVEGVYNGISAALQQHGGTVLGGDCSSGAIRMLSVTALGRLGPLRLLRSDAQPGDVLISSGPHGLSRLGLALLQNDPQLQATSLNASLQSQAISQHQRPQPRLDALNQLLACKPTHLPWRAGGTDSSDGLLAAVRGLCSSSGTGARLDRNRLPKAHGWPNGEPWERWCLAGGEDFELILSLPEAWADALEQALPGCKRFGRITDNAGSVIWSDDNSPVMDEGFDHFGQG